MPDNKKVLILEKCINNVHSELACVSQGVKIMLYFLKTAEFYLTKWRYMPYFELQ
jgi:hypothetical protein